MFKLMYLFTCYQNFSFLKTVSFDNAFSRQPVYHLAHNPKIRFVVTQLGLQFFFQAVEQTKRYETLSNQCRTISGNTDLAHLSRSLPIPTGRNSVIKRIFVPPQPPASPEAAEGDVANGHIINVSKQSSFCTKLKLPNPTHLQWAHLIIFQLPV